MKKAILMAIAILIGNQAFACVDFAPERPICIGDVVYYGGQPGTIFVPQGRVVGYQVSYVDRNGGLYTNIKGTETSLVAEVIAVNKGCILDGKLCVGDKVIDDQNEYEVVGLPANSRDDGLSLERNDTIIIKTSKSKIYPTLIKRIYLTKDCAMGICVGDMINTKYRDYPESLEVLGLPSYQGQGFIVRNNSDRKVHTLFDPAMIKSILKKKDK